jgi:hypothetical protein
MTLVATAPDVERPPMFAFMNADNAINKASAVAHSRRELEHDYENIETPDFNWFAEIGQ